MGFERSYKEISIEDIYTTKILARQENIDANIDKLADSIRLQGLFSPVLVVDSGNGKYELISGQRRMKAYRDILYEENPNNYSTIPAFVYQDMAEWEKRAISINENFNQEPSHLEQISS